MPPSSPPATDSRPRTIVVTGSSGLIGRALCRRLEEHGDRVVRLVRTREAAEDEHALYWNIADGEIDRKGLEEAAPDAVIHLAGKSVYALRWTRAKKRRILDSRSMGTTLLSETIAGLSRKPVVLLSASAGGIYGDHGDRPVTEESALGSGFLAEVCRAWEAATNPAEEAGIRTVHMRTGVVLAQSGILLKRIVPLYRMGLGGPLGMGNRYIPWIAIDDVVSAMLHLLDSQLEGPVNLAAPGFVTGRAFGKALGRVLRRPSIIPAPAPLLSLLGGEMAREIALTSIRLSPQRLLEDGFAFAFPEVRNALEHTLNALAGSA